MLQTRATRVDYDNHIVYSRGPEIREVFALCGLGILLIAHAQMLFVLLLVNVNELFGYSLFLIFLLVNDVVPAFLNGNDVLFVNC